MTKTVFSMQSVVPLEFSVNPVYPGRLEVDSGLTIGLTEGGTPYAYVKARPQVMHILRFDDLPASEYDGGFDYASGTQAEATQSLVNWFVNVVPPGGGTFTYTDPSGSEHMVEFVDAKLEFSLTSKGRYSGSVRLKEYIG